MDVVSSKQTLILAGEAVPARTRPLVPLASSSVPASATASGSVVVQPAETRSALQRAAPQSTTSRSVPVRYTAWDIPRDDYGNPTSRSTTTIPSSYLTPTEHYARTQRNLESYATLGYVDVHA